MEETKVIEKKDNKKTVKKVLTIVFNVLFYTIVVLLLLFALATAIGNVQQKKRREKAEAEGTILQDYNIPSLFGIGLLSVQSDSMDMTTGNEDEHIAKIKKDSFEIGDLLIVKTATPKRIANLVPEESIITYFDVEENKLITHRLVDIIEYPGGKKVYKAQGDRVEVINPDADYNDPDDTYQVTLVQEEDIIAIYSGKFNGGGSFLEFLQTRLGLGLCVLLPCFLFLVFEVIVLIRNIFAVNKEKMKEEYANQPQFDAEAEKEKIRQQILAEMAAKEAENKEAAKVDEANEDAKESNDDSSNEEGNSQE